MNILKFIVGKFRLLFGFCPECNSDAPEIYECPVCRSNQEPKRNWWKEFRKWNGVILLLAVSTAAFAADPIKIIKIETLSGIDNSALSFDGNIATSWFQGWNLQSAKCRVTFDQPYKISKIRYFDGTGQPRLNIYTSENSPTPIKTIALSQYWLWLEESLDVTTNSLTIEIMGIQGNQSLPEIEFYGKPAGNTPPIIPPPPTVPPPDTRDNSLATSKISCNAFHWTPIEPMKIFAMKRDFQRMEWTWSPLGFSPDPLYGAASTNVQGYDKYFADVKAAGITLSPCVNETPAWFWNIPPEPAMYATGDFDIPYYNPKLSFVAEVDTINEPPTPLVYSTPIHPKTLPKGAGAQKDDPFAYIECARYFFQYAARYGNQKWDTLSLELNQEHVYPNSPIAKKVSGLGTISYLEPGNEPEPFWLDQTVYAQPEQFAAYMSAIYDGHCGMLGRDVGIKTADSTMLVVMPGLTNADRGYRQRAINWCIENRPDKTIPWDIDNFHFYNNKGNVAGVWPPRQWTEGVPADMDAGWPDVIAFVNECKKAGRQVWWSEMGYDSRGPSWQEARAYGPYKGDSLQAMWLVRNYLVGIAAGIDQIFTFNAINEPGAPNGGLYQNSGVLYGAGDITPFAPKPAWYAIRTLVKTLDGYKYRADISIASTVKIMTFSKEGKSLIAYWSPTASDKKVTFKYQGKTLVAEETVKYLEFKGERSVSIRPNILKKIFTPKSTPKLVKPW